MIRDFKFQKSMGILLCLLTVNTLVLSQDYEKLLTESSEKFLTYSQLFVKYASQNVSTETDYYIALTYSDIAKAFYHHTSYVNDFLLILKIVKKNEKEKELASRLFKLRLDSVIKECDDAVDRIKLSLGNVENESIVAAANKLSQDLSSLKKVLEEIPK